MREQHLHRKFLLTLSALAIFCGAGLARAQSSQSATTPMNPDITRREVAVFDNFTDSHPELAGQLQKDPSLVNNREFVDSHPALQQFLQEHPEVREEIKESPNAFMHREERYEQHEGNSDHRGDRDITRAQLANMDGFLDRHPEIAEQLQKDPSLIDNRSFVENHPALKEFLTDHPQLKKAFDKNPNAFMHREDRFDSDPTHRQLAIMDHFLDSHPEIAEQLRKDPSLVDNKNFVAAHPALQDFMQQHPEIRQDIDTNPNAFMKQEDRFDRGEDNRWGHDRDTTRGELASFHQFLDGHSRIADQLNRNPELAKNDEYMEGHPELRQYLQAHPGVQEELTENPQSFVKSAQQFTENGATQPKLPATPKSPVLDQKPKL